MDRGLTVCRPEREVVERWVSHGEKVQFAAVFVKKARGVGGDLMFTRIERNW